MPFAVEVFERLVVQKKKGDYRNALKVIDKMHDRGQLGPGGVLPYIRYIGMCHPKGYGF